MINNLSDPLGSEIPSGLMDSLMADSLYMLFVASISTNQNPFPGILELDALLDIESREDRANVLDQINTKLRSEAASAVTKSDSKEDVTI